MRYCMRELKGKRREASQEVKQEKDLGLMGSGEKVAGSFSADSAGRPVVVQRLVSVFIAKVFNFNRGHYGLYC